MRGKKGDRERETRGMKDGCVQEVKQGECGGERKDGAVNDGNGIQKWQVE